MHSTHAPYWSDCCPPEVHYRLDVESNRIEERYHAGVTVCPSTWMWPHRGTMPLHLLGPDKTRTYRTLHWGSLDQGRTTDLTKSRLFNQTWLKVHIRNQIGLTSSALILDYKSQNIQTWFSINLKEHREYLIWRITYVASTPNSCSQPAGNSKLRFSI